MRCRAERKRDRKVRAVAAYLQPDYLHGQMEIFWYIFRGIHFPATMVTFLLGYYCTRQLRNVAGETTASHWGREWLPSRHLVPEIVTGRDVNELGRTSINISTKPYVGKIYWGKPSEIPRGQRVGQHLRILSEDIHEEQYSAENALQQINFSKLRIEIIFWEIALKKGTETSGGTRIFPKLCSYICTTVRDHVDLYCSVLPTSRCDTRILAITPREVFPQSVLAYDVFTNVGNYCTTHTPHNG